MASQASSVKITPNLKEWLPKPRSEPLFRGFPALATGLGFLGLMSLTWSSISFILARFLDPTQGRILGRRVITQGFRIYLGFLSRMGFVHIDLGDIRELAELKTPFILAPNHPGLLDAVILLATYPDIGCILKADILDIPFFGAGARLAAYIRNDKRQQMIRDSIHELKEGRKLLLFPEGTRTTRSPVNVFKDGPALIAKNAGVPIETVLISYDCGFLGKNWPLFKVPNLPIHVKLQLGKRFDPSSSVRETTRCMEAYFHEALAASDILQADKQKLF